MKIYFLHFSKRFTALGFVVGLLLAFLWPNHVASQTTITFSYTGAMQTWVVPSGVNSVVIKASGAQGGNAAVGGTGGAGGYAEGTLAVTPGQVLNIFVGGQNGFNGGGIGGINGNNVFGGPSLGLAPSGGGATDVRVSGTALGDRVIVAGGGGGAGHNGTWIGCQVAGPAGNGGSGGSLTGGNGTFGVGTPCNCGGGGGDGGIGGTQATGGAAGGYVGSPNCLRPSWTIGQNGSLGQGGNGSTTFYNGTGGGGGGGGGYYGGGSGGSGSDTTPGGGGGGGSSYIGGVTAGVMTSGVRSGDGTLDITFLADILTCPTDLTVPACQTQAAVNAAFNTWIGSVQILAGCNDGVITTDVGAPPACGGTSTVTFTLTGNSCSPTVPVTCTANFTVEFPDDIVLTGCPPPAVQLRCNPNIPSCGIVPSPTVSGGCSTVLVCMESPITQFGCERTRTLTWTATDNCNQSSTCSTDYTWTEDTTPPVLSGCPPTEVNLGCNPTTIPTCAVVPSPTATDACGSGEVICADFGITVDGCLRTKTLYWSSIDLCNNDATCETTYTWTEDTTPPVLSGCPPASVNLGCNPTTIPSCANVPSPTATDGCGTPTVVCSETDVMMNGCLRTKTLTWTATDECGNPASCSTLYTWTVDVTPPLLSGCYPTIVNLGCNPTTIPSCDNVPSPTATDACGTPTVTCIASDITAPSTCVRRRTLSWTATDGCGNGATCSTIYTWTVDPPVTLTCPVNTTTAPCLTQDQVNALYNTWLASATFTGGCNATISNNGGTVGPPSACGGTRTVIFTVTGACAPPTSCTATFTVPAPPTVVLTCPTPTIVASCQTQDQVNAQFAAWLASASASGGCNDQLTNNNQGPPSICGGTTTVTFVYTSNCAPLTTTCTSTFTVTAPPTVVLTCPAPMVMSPCSTQAQVNAAYAAWLASATASGGCNGALTNNNTLAAPSICNTGPVTRTITWTYTSSCAPLTTTCTSTFTLPAYPDFTVPASAAATVPCPANATQPVPPVVNNGCGTPIVPTGPVIVNNPNPLTCEGTRTYTWTYTDCAGRARTWSFVYTIERLDFTVPANSGATVDCPDDTDLVPTPPVVLSNCGEVLTPVLINTDAKPLCNGVRRYTWRYTDCEGNSHDWSFVYTVVYQDFTIPPAVNVTKECPQAATVPTPPIVFDNCGKELTPVGPTLGYTYNAFGCEATRTYSYVYKDCSGFSHTWQYAYRFLYEGNFAIFADQYDEVSCEKFAVEPIPPTILDFCGSPTAVWLSNKTEDIDPLGCMGTRTYTFTYRDCGGHSYDWKYTYFIKDDIAPMGDIPNVDEEVACMEDLPCPDDDFSDKMAEIIAEGGFYDNCKEPIAMLDSWTDVTACSDPDGDGVFTFSRTYYFVIKDRCGNAYPELVPVTYWGECQPLGHFSMKDWGIEGGLPASETNGASSDLQVVGLLLSNGGPLKIGGNQRSITLSDAQCVMNMLPGTGGPAVLAHCHQTNCTGGCNPMGIGGLKNALAANAIALELNIRYGVQINLIEGLNVARGTSLECIHLHPCIQDCNAQGVCQLRIFDALGAEYAFPYTVGGLQDLVNLYLNGGLDLSGGLSVIYGTAMNESLELLSSYGNSEMLAALCNGGDDRNLWSDAFDGLDDIDGLDWSPNIKIAPNPASAVFNFRLSRMEQPSDVVLTLYNSLGQVALTQRFDQVQRLNEDIRIDRLNAGVYFLDVKLGGKHHNTKLVIQR